MIVGLGLDIVDVARLRRVCERRGERFLRRVFTDAEIASCRRRADPCSSFAARFAAKEAGMKAIGTGWANGVGWHDLEVVSNSASAPRMALWGRAAERAKALGAEIVQLSLSHDAGVAAAVVVLESRREIAP